MSTHLNPVVTEAYQPPPMCSWYLTYCLSCSCLTASSMSPCIRRKDAQRAAGISIKLSLFRSLITTTTSPFSSLVSIERRSLRLYIFNEMLNDKTSGLYSRNLYSWEIPLVIKNFVRTTEVSYFLGNSPGLFGQVCKNSG